MPRSACCATLRCAATAAAELLERTPSMSSLNEVIYSQPCQTHDDHSFVFLMKVCMCGWGVLHLNRGTVKCRAWFRLDIQSSRMSPPREPPTRAPHEPSSTAPSPQQVADPGGGPAPRTLYGVCAYARELVHRPPAVARAAFPEQAAAPLSRYMVVAPRCYCLLSHYPFFGLHFRVGGQGGAGARVGGAVRGRPGRRGGGLGGWGRDGRPGGQEWAGS